MAQVRTADWIDQFSAVRGRLARLAREITTGLEALHRVQFDEPWKMPRRTTHGR